MIHLFGVAWRDLRAAWSVLLVIHILCRIAAFALLTPLVGAALRAFVSISGNTVIADQDILFFFLSPIGLTAFVVVAATSIGIIAVEQAALMTVGLGVTRGRAVGALAAVRLVARRTGSVLELAARLVIRVLVLTAPFLAASGGVYLWLLTEFDINFYLAERPSELFLAALLIGAILLAGALVLLPRIVSWSYALPIQLFEEKPPAAAIAASVSRTAGSKRTITVTILGWIALSLFVSMLSFTVLGVAAQVVVPRAQGSLTLLVIVMGGVALVFGLVSLLVTMFQTSLIALLIARLYGQGEDARLPELASPRESRLGLKLTLSTALAGVVAVAALSAAIGVWLVRGVRTDDDVLVIAHRGAAGRAPENTLAAVRAALEDGADIVEIDVQETADGEVVVLHDSDFMKIAGVSSKIWETSFAEARSIDIGSWFGSEFTGERIPTLAEVLALCKGKARVDIELKYYGHDERLEERVVDIVEREAMAVEVVVMSLSQDAIREIRELRPGWTIGLLSAKAVGDLTRVDVDFLAVHTGLVRPRFVRSAHMAGKDVYAWTVNDPVHMSRMVSRGVDGLITDEPALARQVLAERANLSSVERLLLEAAVLLGAFSTGPPAEEDL